MFEKGPEQGGREGEDFRIRWYSAYTPDYVMQLCAFPSTLQLRPTYVLQISQWCKWGKWLNRRKWFYWSSFLQESVFNIFHSLQSKPRAAVTKIVLPNSCKFAEHLRIWSIANHRIIEKLKTSEKFSKPQNRAPHWTEPSGSPFAYGIVSCLRNVSLPSLQQDIFNCFVTCLLWPILLGFPSEPLFDIGGALTSLASLFLYSCQRLE